MYNTFVLQLGRNDILIKRYIHQLKSEFHGYNGKRFLKDTMAGLTVAAVALPLALAFGVSSGAGAASGLVTAIIAGFVISALSGASFQISGPTGAMAAILTSIVVRYTLQGVFVVGLMAGVILLLAAIFKLGRIISIIPRPVITGFTSGIAIIIALGQIDAFFGTTSQGESALQKVFSYGTIGFHIQWQALLIGLIVVAFMLLWPKKWGSVVPSSLAGIVVATLASSLLGFSADTIGAIPQTLMPAARLDLLSLDFSTLPALISPAVSVAALAMVESLLCGTSAVRMKKGGVFDADQELFAQGIGNMLVPFFGGIPVTAAIARSSVAIKSGGQTRMTGIIHALGLLASMFLLSGVMARIPYAALAGVLLVTAWRMNEWPAIKGLFSRRNISAILKFLITMAATVVFDLTIAIVIGMVFAAFAFVYSSSKLCVTSSKVKNKLLHAFDDDVEKAHKGTTVLYITGPVFFGNAEKLLESVRAAMTESDKLIFSMRGVSGMDTTGAEIILDSVRECREQNVEVVFCGLHESMRKWLDQVGITEIIDEDAFFFSVDRALVTPPSDTPPQS